MAKSQGRAKKEVDVLAALRKCLAKVTKDLDADVILYSGRIDYPGDANLFNCVRSFRKRPNVLFHLTTNGGAPESAFRIGRCLQKLYPPPGRIFLFVDTFCKSAGTLVALGADEIVMGELAELGPLDIQLQKEDALAEQTSGLTPTKAIEILSARAFECLEESFLKLRFRSGLQITTRTALEIAGNMTTGLFSPIFAQIDPMRLGEIERAMAIAREYGTRLARGNLKDGAIDHLVEHYPSHGFVIDKEEAAEIFGCVRVPSEAEEQLSELVAPFVAAGQKSAEEDKPATVEFLSILLEKTGRPDNGTKDAKPQRIQRAAGSDGAPTDKAVRSTTGRNFRRKPNTKPNTPAGDKSVLVGQNGPLTGR